MPADVSKCVEKLDSPNVVVKAEAAQRLAQMGCDAQSAAVPLVHAVGTTNESVREWVVVALESIGVPAAGDLNALRGLVSAEDADVSYWAITLLGRLQADAAPAVPILIDALRHNPHSHSRQRAAWALGKIGPDAREALPALREAARGVERRLARIALLSIEQISQPTR